MTTLNEIKLEPDAGYEQFFVRDLLNVDVYVKNTKLRNYDRTMALATGSDGNLVIHEDFFNCGCKYKMYLISRYNLNLNGAYSNDSVTKNAKTYKDALLIMRELYESSLNTIEHNYRILTGRVYCLKKPQSPDYPLDRPEHHIPIDEDTALDLRLEFISDIDREEQGYPSNYRQYTY